MTNHAVILDEKSFNPGDLNLDNLIALLDSWQEKLALAFGMKILIAERVGSNTAKPAVYCLTTYYHRSMC